MKKTIHEYLGVNPKMKFVERPKQPLLLVLQDCDVKGADKKSPGGCAIAQCGKRMFGSPAVAVFSRVAYFVLKDKKGKSYIGKYQATASTKRKITAFDETGEMPEGAIEFKPIAATHTRMGRQDYHIFGPKKVLGKRKVAPARSRLTRTAPRVTF